MTRLAKWARWTVVGVILLSGLNFLPYWQNSWLTFLFVYIPIVLVTNRICLLIFDLTTYSAYFLKALPLLLGYAILVGMLLASTPLFSQFGVTHLWGNTVLFIWEWKRQVRQSQWMLDSVENDTEAYHFAAMSMANTKAYYWLSVMAYLICSFLAYSVWFIRLLDESDLPS